MLVQVLVKSNTADVVLAYDLGAALQVRCVWSFCREVQLERALLLYFTSQHATAIEELERYKTGCVGSEGEQIDVLSSKSSYINFENMNW